MASKAPEPIELRPGRGLWIAASLSLLAFLGATAVCHVTDAGKIYTSIGVVLMLIGLLGLLELGLGRMRFDENGFSIRGLHQQQNIRLDEITEARLEGGTLYLKTQEEEWKGLPFWLSGRDARSLRQKVGAILRAREEEAE